jgi:hypothetical protein
MRLDVDVLSSRTQGSSSVFKNMPVGKVWTASALWCLTFLIQIKYPPSCCVALVRLQGRARMKSGSRSAGGVLAKNPRAGYRPLPTPPPGDPSLTGLARADMIWTIQADEAAMLTAVPVEAEDLAWAMVWREADKQGNISVPRCKALNINDGEQGQGLGLETCEEGLGGGGWGKTCMQWRTVCMA